MAENPSWTLDGFEMNYKGVPVPPGLRPNWDSVEAEWWRRGILAALQAEGYEDLPTGVYGTPGYTYPSLGLEVDSTTPKVYAYLVRKSQDYIFGLYRWEDASDRVELWSAHDRGWREFPGFSSLDKVVAAYGRGGTVYISHENAKDYMKILEKQVDTNEC